jgi:hypothetical protein
VFSKYDNAADNKAGSISLEEWFIFVKDLGIDISQACARQCFAESKYCVVNEMDPILTAQMNKLTFLEMLDAVVRLAVMLFEESEWYEYTTRKKVWYLMDSILATIDEQRVYPEAIDKVLPSDSEDSNDEEP